MPSPISLERLSCFRGPGTGDAKQFPTGLTHVGPFPFHCQAQGRFSKSSEALELSHRFLSSLQISFGSFDQGVREIALHRW